MKKKPSSSHTIDELLAIIMQQAKEKGFGTKKSDINFSEKISLIHSEVSEAFEAYRHKNMTGRHGVEEELGDVIQRVLHLCGVMNIDIEKAILKKIKINDSRVWDWKKMNEK